MVSGAIGFPRRIFTSSDVHLRSQHNGVHGQGSRVEVHGLPHKVCHHRGRSNRDQDREDNHERGTHLRSLDEVGGNHQAVRELVVESDHICLDLRSNHGEEDFYHGKHRDGDCSHEEVHGDHNHHHHMGGDQEIENERVNHEEYLAESEGVRRDWSTSFLLLTSATQVTRAPLNSRPSSFSTAVFKSAAVSNSTKLLFC